MAGLVVAGRSVIDGLPIEFCVDDDRITFDLSRSTSSATRLSGWISPGLTDLHCHIGLGPGGVVSAGEAMAQLLADRAAGTTLIRDAGSPADTRWLDEVVGTPRIIRSGRHIARHRRYLLGYGRDVEPGGLVAAVIEEAGRGDGWVKIVADWIDRGVGAGADLSPLWSVSELSDAVAAAHHHGARVTVHAFSHVVVDDLLDAGVDCIEHGTGIDADQANELASRRVPVVPTLLQVANFADIADRASRYPVYAAHMRDMHRRWREQVQLLAGAGVQLLPGTDAGGTIQHGALPAELRRWLDAGIPGPDVVVAAFVRAREFLRAPGVVEGGPADVVVYADDPRQVIDTLAAPIAVIIGGDIVEGAFSSWSSRSARG